MCLLCCKHMGRFRRSGNLNRIIVQNQKIYASYTFGSMGALFALRPLKKGEILAEYTGKILTQKAADESSSHHLIRAYKQTRAGADTAVDRVIDGRGELAGFANYAPFDIANAFVLDILPTLLKRCCGARMDAKASCRGGWNPVDGRARMIIRSYPLAFSSGNRCTGLT